MLQAPPLPPDHDLEQVLSRTRSGWVVLARHGGALRVLRLDPGGTGGEARAELAALAAARHPGIVPLLDHGPLPGGGSYVARAWVEGLDLATWARGRDPEQVGALVARLCPALDALHAAGFVHGDLKPQNVLVADGDRPLLVDFGLARRDTRAHETGAEPAEQGVPDETGVSGSLLALAPEVLLGAVADARSDLFALGVLLHGCLTTPRRTAAEFYADFPRSSFLDAAATPPEALPEWARDLVVSLTAREPSRRPATAGEVGRALAARLGEPWDARPGAEVLRWNAGRGRAPWMRRELVQGDAGRLWWSLPEGEDPRALKDVLLVHLGLTGRPARELVLDSLDDLSDELAIDRWAAEAARAPVAELVLALSSGGTARLHVLDCLARACDQRRRDHGAAPRPVVLAPEDIEPPAADGPSRWHATDVPRVSAEQVRAFLVEALEPAEGERLTTFAEGLARAAGGAANRVDRLLAQAFERGAIVVGEKRLRLRAGALPEPDAWEGVRTYEPRNAEEHDLVGALALLGGRASLDRLATLLGLGASDLAATGARLHAARLLDLTGHELRLLVPARARLSSPDATRRLHAVLAESLPADRAAQRAAHLIVHGSEGGPGGERGPAVDELHAALAHALEALRDQGRHALVLGRIDELGRWLSALEQPLPVRLRAEAALAWCGLGQPDPAERALGQEPLQAPAPDRAAHALARARIATLRGLPKQARAELERAHALDPAFAGELYLDVLRDLYGRGRDLELIEHSLGADGARARETRGALTVRQRAFGLSIAALGLLRLGRVDEARDLTSELLLEARRDGDEAREAALDTNLATIERRAGALDAAIGALERAQVLYEAVGQASGLAHVRETYGGLLREKGELSRGEALVRSALEIRERLGDEEGSARLRGVLGLVLFERGHARAAIATLEESVLGLRAARHRQHAPLLEARAAELRARLGYAVETPAEPAADPRVFVSFARIAWCAGRVDEALALLDRATAMARSMKLDASLQEAAWLSAHLRGEGPEAPDEGTLTGEDALLIAAIRAPASAAASARLLELARSLEERGRDDRAARAWIALAARVDDTAEFSLARSRAQELLATCAAGATDAERAELERHLLGLPDPRPEDFAARTKHATDEEFEMQIASLLDINRELASEEHLDRLLGRIVESALRVTGAERGFLVLEEDGELRFDTARDSCRGEVGGSEFLVSESVVRRALELGKPIRIANAVDDPWLSTTASVVTLELRSVLCVPIEIDGGLRAALYLDHRLRTDAFDERAEELCLLLADQAALAVQKLRRMEEIRALNQQLSERVQRQAADLQDARLALARQGSERPDAVRLVGRSAVMQRVGELIERFAPTGMPVLVAGPSGTGKEVAARALHAASGRSDQPFVSENCAAIPATLIESELFGHEKGAFTGAERVKRGLFEEADGGTIFLDEVGELPLELQAKLLRVLESGEVRRLGASEPRWVDARVIVATNRDLRAEVAAGRFREDLFYRLDGLSISMPPLAERVEDVPLLVQHFLAAEEARGGKPRRVSQSVLARLSRRSWPGNVRELRNEVARLCVLSPGDLEDPDLIRSPGPERGVEPAEVVPLAELERRAILDAVERTGGDKREAAKLLGISRAKIYQRLKEWTEE